MTDWSPWGDCTKVCGTGQITRTRDVLAPPVNGGLPCGDTTENDPCNTQRCPEDRAAILVDRIRKLELQDRINTLEELQVKQATDLAASQTQDLLAQIGGVGNANGASSTGSDGSNSLLEQLSDLYESKMHKSPSTTSELQLQQLNSLKHSIESAKAELRQLSGKDVTLSVQQTKQAIITAKAELHQLKDSKNVKNEDVVTDEIDAQGHHHKKHHRRHKHTDSNSKFPTSPTGEIRHDIIPPLFAHTIAIPAGNNK